MKYSIRTKLLSAVFAIITILSFVSVGFFVMHVVVVENYKSISDNMINEYRLIQVTNDLIDNYNTRYRNIDTEDAASEKSINGLREEIVSIEKYLDQAITNQDSLVSYIGLKNTIQNVTAEIDLGLADITAKNVESISLHYEAANAKLTFVKENGSELILNELKYVNTLQSRIAFYYKISLIGGVLGFIIIVLGCIIYLTSFVNRLVQPLQKLSGITQQITAGNMNISIDKSLLEEQDEIGSLANSYHLMIQKLIESIANLTKASTDLSAKNTDLERLNQFMVGRELKMVELKKLNTALQKKLAETNPTALN